MGGWRGGCFLEAQKGDGEGPKGSFFTATCDCALDDKHVTQLCRQGLSRNVSRICCTIDLKFLFCKLLRLSSM